MMFTHVFIITKLFLLNSWKGPAACSTDVISFCANFAVPHPPSLSWGKRRHACEWACGFGVAAGALRCARSHVRQSTQLCSRLIVAADLPSCLGEHLALALFLRGDEAVLLLCLSLPLTSKKPPTKGSEGCSGPLGFVSQLLAPTLQTVQCFPSAALWAGMLIWSVPGWDSSARIWAGVRREGLIMTSRFNALPSQARTWERVLGNQITLAACVTTGKR